MLLGREIAYSCRGCSVLGPSHSIETTRRHPKRGGRSRLLPRLVYITSDNICHMKCSGVAAIWLWKFEMGTSRNSTAWNQKLIKKICAVDLSRCCCYLVMAIRNG